MKARSTFCSTVVVTVLLFFVVASASAGNSPLNVYYNPGYQGCSDSGSVRIVLKAGNATNGQYGFQWVNTETGGTGTTVYTVSGGAVGADVVLTSKSYSGAGLGGNYNPQGYNSATVTSGPPGFNSAMVSVTGAPQTLQRVDVTGTCASVNSARGGDINIVLNATPPPTTDAQFNGKLTVPAHSKVHTLGLKLNGSLVGGSLSSTYNSAVSQTLNLSAVQTVKTGDTYEWLVDGFGQGVNTITLTNIGGNGDPPPVWVAGPFSLNVSTTGGDVNGPAGTPTPPPANTPAPTPAASPTPYSTAPPVSGGNTQVTTTTTTTNGSQTVTSGAVTVVNPQDIYKPIVDGLSASDAKQRAAIRDGLEDAAADSSAPGIDTGFTVGPTPAGQSKQGTDDLKKEVDETIADAKTSIGAGQQKLLGLEKLTVPAVSGSKTSWSVTLPKLGSFNVSIAPYATQLALMRLLLLIFLIIGAWFASVKIIRSAIA
jgi:hypothetical protein